MAELLVIREGSAADEVEWLVVDDQGALVEPADRASLPALARRASNRRVVLLVPALDVLLTRVALPVRGKQKILQALPFAMEEQLAEDVEALHFAAGDRDSDERLRVAVVRRDRIEAWRTRLAQAGLEANAAYCEAEGLDRIDGTAVLMVEADVVSLRTPDGGLASTDLEGFETLIELWLAGRGNSENETLPNLLVYVAGDMPASLQASLDAFQPRLQSIEVRALAEGPLPRLAANLAVAPGINLLQGAFSRRSNLGRFWPAWRVAALLLAGVLVAAIASVAAESWRLGRRAEALQQSVEQAFRYTFPDVRQIRDPRAQMESRLRALGGGGEAAGTEFLDALTQVARAVGGAEGTRLEGIDYRSGTLELRLRAPSVEVLDKIQRDIASGGGFEAEIQSANADKDAVLGRLRIRTAGA